jgi:hypothetical protein
MRLGVFVEGADRYGIADTSLAFERRPGPSSKSTLACAGRQFSAAARTILAVRPRPIRSGAADDRTLHRGALVASHDEHRRSPARRRTAAGAEANRHRHMMTATAMS